jgi:hypothetical protein
MPPSSELLLELFPPLYVPLHPRAIIEPLDADAGLTEIRPNERKVISDRKNQAKYERRDNLAYPSIFSELLAT